MFRKLMNIQTKIKADKNLVNKFGGYTYRNAEAILAAVKPYLIEENCSLTLTDEIIAIGSRVYVKATATLFDNESEKSICTHGLAREAEMKKGMDDSQITGTASSYARKYALGGLLLLDDTKDPDSDEHHKEAEEKKKRAEKEEAEEKKKRAEEEAHNKEVEDISKMKISKIKVDALAEKAVADGVPLGRICTLYKVADIESMNEKQYRNCMDNWQKIKEME